MPSYNFDTIETVIMNSTEVFTVKKESTTVYVKCLLNFDERGGSLVSNKYIYYNRVYGTLPTTSKSYSTFLNWRTAINGGGSIITSSSSYEEKLINKTLYADWTPSQSGYYASATSISLDYGVSQNATLYAQSGATAPTAYYWYLSDIAAGNASITNSSSQTATINNTNVSASDDYGYVYCRITVDGKYLYYSIALTLFKYAGSMASYWDYLDSYSSPTGDEDYYLGILDDPYLEINSAFPASNYLIGTIASVYSNDSGMYDYFEAV